MSQIVHGEAGQAGARTFSSLPGRRILSASFLAAMLLWASFSHAAGNFVVTSLADSGPGSLRSCMSDAIAAGGGDITFSNISGTIVIQTNLPGIVQPLNIIGPGSSVLAVSGNLNYRIFRSFPGVTWSISGLTIKDGKPWCEDGNVWTRSGCDGGGILNQGNLTISDCWILNNKVQNSLVNESGGGIWSSGSLTMSNVLVQGNSAFSRGGGVLALGDLTMKNCIVSGNGSHDFTGGIVCAANTSITKSAIKNNGSGEIGGLEVTGGIAVVTDSCITSNGSAIYGPGGGIVNRATLYLTNCTVSGNRSDQGQGSAIVNRGNLTAVNCTIVSNLVTYPSTGAAVSNYPSAVFFAKNSLIANNLAGTAKPVAPGIDFAGILNSGGCNLIRLTNAVTVIIGDPSGNIYGRDPLLGPLVNNGGLTLSHALLPGSPALDAGNSSGAPGTDQEGLSRPQGQNVDIGAFEAICAQCGPLLITQCHRNSDGTVQLTASGIPGDQCVVLGSVDAVGWAPVGSATNVAGTLSFTDTTSAGVPNRFYRLQKVGPILP